MCVNVSKEPILQRCACHLVYTHCVDDVVAEPEAHPVEVAVHAAGIPPAIWVPPQPLLIPFGIGGIVNFRYGRKHARILLHLELPRFVEYVDDSTNATANLGSRFRGSGFRDSGVQRFRGTRFTAQRPRFAV